MYYIKSDSWSILPVTVQAREVGQHSNKQLLNSFRSKRRNVLMEILIQPLPFYQVELQRHCTDFKTQFPLYKRNVVTVCAAQMSTICLALSCQ